MKSVLMIMIAATTAFAQPSADQQKKVDAAKTAACEKSKKFMAAQKTKGKCTAEADAAAKITCAPATAKQVNDLFKKCTSAKPPEKKPVAK